MFFVSLATANVFSETPEVGGAGGARAPPSFGISVNPIRTKGADYARHITTVPPHHFGRCGVSVTYKQCLATGFLCLVSWLMLGAYVLTAAIIFNF